VPVPAAPQAAETPELELDHFEARSYDIAATSWHDQMTRWIWDTHKAGANLRNHKVSFALARRVFGDPDVVSRRDPYPGGERWQSIGRPSAASELVLFVVHTEPVRPPEGEGVGRNHLRAEGHQAREESR
jgi:uncharacterized DUF497 family protein